MHSRYSTNTTPAGWRAGEEGEGVDAQQPVGIGALRTLQRLIGELNRSRRLPLTLQAVVDGVVTGLGFDVAAVNLVRDDGDLEVVAAAGSRDAAAALLGRVGRRADWEAALATAQPWGDLRFVPHESYAPATDPLPSWVPDIVEPADPQAWHPLDALFAPLVVPDGGLVGVLSVDLPAGGRRPGPEQRDLLEMYAAQAGIAIDNARLTERLRAESKALRASEELFRLAFEGAPVGMAINDLAPTRLGRFLRVNDALCVLLGYTRPELLTRTILDVVAPEHRHLTAAALDDATDGRFRSGRAERRYRRADGGVGWAAVSAAVICGPDGTPWRIVSQLLDITERKSHEQRLAEQALHDPLTGLPNRLLLLQRLEHAVARARRSGAPAAVLFCDVDGLKEVNDRYGHRTGDEVLVATAARLLAQVRSVDTVARLGGDEFVVLAEDTTAAQAEELAERLRRALSAQIPTATRPLRMTLSVGTAEVTPDVDSAEQVLHRADAAMYRAKRRS